MRKLYEKMERADYVDAKATGHGQTGWLAVNVADNALAATDMSLLNLGVETANFMAQFNNVTGEENLNQYELHNLQSRD
jgi:hypothetical protein